MSDHSTNKEVRHLNDELVSACHAVALNRTAATAAAVASFKLATGSKATSGTLPAGLDVPPASGKVKLLFKGNRVFVFKIVAPELPFNVECIRSFSGSSFVPS